MNASSFITFVTYILRQIGLYVTLKLAPDLKQNAVYLSSYRPLSEGHFSILTNSMLRTYQSYRRAYKSEKFLEIFKEVSPYTYLKVDSVKVEKDLTRFC